MRFQEGELHRVLAEHGAPPVLHTLGRLLGVSGMVRFVMVVNVPELPSQDAKALAPQPPATVVHNEHEATLLGGDSVVEGDNR
jgi:hypothetical protein